MTIPATPKSGSGLKLPSGLRTPDPGRRLQVPRRASSSLISSSPELPFLAGMGKVFGNVFSGLHISRVEPLFHFQTDPRVKSLLLEDLGIFLTTGKRPERPIPSTLPTWFIPSEQIQLTHEDTIRGYGEHSLGINAGRLRLSDGRCLPVALKKVPFELALHELKAAQILHHRGVMDIPYFGFSRAKDGEDLRGHVPFDPQDPTDKNLKNGIVWLVTYRFKHTSEYTEPPAGVMPYGREVYRPDVLHKNNDSRIDNFFCLHQAAMRLVGLRPCLDEETFFLQFPTGWSAGFIDLHHPRIADPESSTYDPLSKTNWQSGQRDALVEIWPQESREALQRLLQTINP